MGQCHNEQYVLQTTVDELMPVTLDTDIYEQRLYLLHNTHTTQQAFQGATSGNRDTHNRLTAYIVEIQTVSTVYLSVY